MTPIIECNQIRYKYGSNVVLQDVDFVVEERDYVGLVGPNGSGKSTLLQIILGLLQPDAGTIELFNQPIATFKNWYKIGYVSQKANSFNSGFPARVTEVVAMGLYGKLGLWKRMTNNDRKKVDDVIEQVGLADYRTSNIGRLSGGQQQRAFIARGLVSEPELLILDEPTVGVDSESVEKFYQLLAKLHEEQGLTLLMVTHDIGMMTHHVNKVACLNKQIHFHGNSAEFEKRQTSILEKTYGSFMHVVEHHH